MLTILAKLLPTKALAKFLTNAAICVLAVAGTYYWHAGKVQEAENQIRVELAQTAKRQIDQLTINALRVESELKDQIRKVEDDKQIQKAIDADRSVCRLEGCRVQPICWGVAGPVRRGRARGDGSKSKAEDRY